LTAGEILQLPANDALVLVSGVPPIRASKLKYYADHNFLARRLAAPQIGKGGSVDAPARRGDDDWSGQMRTTDARLERVWSELVTNGSGRAPEQTPELALDFPSEPDSHRDALNGESPGHRAEHGSPHAHNDDDDDLIPR